MIACVCLPTVLRRAEAVSLDLADHHARLDMGIPHRSAVRNEDLRLLRSESALRRERLPGHILLLECRARTRAVLLQTETGCALVRYVVSPRHVAVSGDLQRHLCTGAVAYAISCCVLIVPQRRTWGRNVANSLIYACFVIALHGLREQVCSLRTE